MNLRTLADILIRSVSGGENGIDNKYAPEYVETLIPALRNDAIILDYYGGRTRAASRRLDYALYQTMDIAVNEVSNNTSDFVTFTLPRTIGVGRLVDGLVYVGQVDESIEFSRMLNRSDISMARTRGLLNGDNIAYIWSQGNLEVYGNNALSEIQVKGIFSDPTQVSGFNIETDDYPVSDSLVNLMTDLFKVQMNVNIQKPADISLDGKETLPTR